MSLRSAVLNCFAGGTVQPANGRFFALLGIRLFIARMCRHVSLAGRELATQLVMSEAASASQNVWRRLLDKEGWRPSNGSCQ